MESSREWDRLSSLEVDRDTVLLIDLEAFTGLMDDLLGLIDCLLGLTDILLCGLLEGDLFGLDLEGLRDFIVFEDDLESALEFGRETAGKLTEALECDLDGIGLPFLGLASLDDSFFGDSGGSLLGVPIIGERGVGFATFL